MCKIMSFADKDSFVSSFQACVSFISLSGLTELTRTFSIMLNRSDSRHLCLVPDLCFTLNMFDVRMLGCGPYSHPKMGAF